MYKDTPLWRITMRQDGRNDVIIHVATAYSFSAITCAEVKHVDYEMVKSELIGSVYVEVNEDQL